MNNFMFSGNCRTMKFALIISLKMFNRYIFIIDSYVVLYHNSLINLIVLTFTHRVVCISRLHFIKKTKRKKFKGKIKGDWKI